MPREQHHAHEGYGRDRADEAYPARRPRVALRPAGADKVAHQGRQHAARGDHDGIPAGVGVRRVAGEAPPGVPDRQERAQAVGRHHLAGSRHGEHPGHPGLLEDLVHDHLQVARGVEDGPLGLLHRVVKDRRQRYANQACEEHRPAPAERHRKQQREGGAARAEVQAHREDAHRDLLLLDEVVGQDGYGSRHRERLRQPDDRPEHQQVQEAVRGGLERGGHRHDHQGGRGDYNARPAVTDPAGKQRASAEDEREAEADEDAVLPLVEAGAVRHVVEGRVLAPAVAPGNVLHDVAVAHLRGGAARDQDLRVILRPQLQLAAGDAELHLHPSAVGPRTRPVHGEAGALGVGSTGGNLLRCNHGGRRPLLRRSRHHSRPAELAQLVASRRPPWEGVDGVLATEWVVRDALAHGLALGHWHGDKVAGQVPRRKVPRGQEEQDE
mmetsp:Transcript_27867/g.72956  ORF Transcript_27867/g.72956 Transcript_27867/m.72956 type:complete len:439 (-) Transcript_27867:192-1508(-)